MKKNDNAGHNNLYQPKEARKQDNKNGLATDVYSFGIVLLEIYNSRLPPQDSLHPKQRNNFLKGIRKVRQKIADIVDVIEKCTREDPNDRIKMNQVFECLNSINNKFNKK